MKSPSFEYINPRYLSGIVDEPKQLLQPISGYAHEPLLPLEEACEPLMELVPRLSAHIWVAKQNSKNPSDGLTEDESAAIRLYTMEWDSGGDEPRSSLYTHLNRTLKQVDRTKLRPWFRYLKLFLTALAKLPSAPRQTVWRGVRKNHSDDYPPGAEATWWAFSSCTTSLSVLESDLYLGNVGTRTLFSIETCNGRTIRPHSHFQVEDEILLLPGTFFEVKSRLNPAPDLYIIHLSQKRPPHDLLEPPFEGAQLFPTGEYPRDRCSKLVVDSLHKKHVDHPWHKQKMVRLAAGATTLLFIAVIVLGATLGARTRRQAPEMIVTTTTSTAPPLAGLYGRIPNPVSIADAFYAFDKNTLDLYSRRNGEVIGGPVSYVQGYIPSGEAISFNQSIATSIQIQPRLQINSTTSFTVEGFFFLHQTQMNATLVQLASNMTLNLIDGVLNMMLGTNVNLTGTQMISASGWHHLGFVYDAKLSEATIYIDGQIEVRNSSVQPDIVFDEDTASIIIGAWYQGYIDQLSISLTAKSQAVILWDATTAGYYPLDFVGSWLLDKGPNFVNAAAANIQSSPGWLNTSLRLNAPGAYYQVSGFSPREKPTRSFSVALWVRTANQSGVFLTITNPYRCVLTMGLRNDDESIVVRLPHANAKDQSVIVRGIKMPPGQWVHVAFTWDIENRVNLYQSAYRQDVYETSKTVVKFNNGADNMSLPIMTVTLGKYDGSIDCGSIDGVDSSKEFRGSLDELYVFTRELTQNEICSLSVPPAYQKSCKRVP